MKAELLSLDQSMSLMNGQTTTWVTFQLPGGHVFRAMVADDEAANLANVVASGGNVEETAPPQPPAAPPYFAPSPSYHQAPPQPHYQGQSPAFDASPVPTGTTRVEWHDDGAPIHTFGGDAPTAPHQPAPEETWQAPHVQTLPAPPPPSRPGVKVWTDPIAQMKAQKRGEVQALPSRTVDKDEKGNPVVRVAGGVDVESHVRTSDAPGDDDGVASV